MNIMHRDIKKANILVGSDQKHKLKVWLADLGISSRLESKAARRISSIGTPGYFPPEMIKKKPYGLPIDIWSLGVMMHSLLAISLPFHDKDKSSHKRRVCTEELDLDSVKILDNVSVEAKDLMRGMLTKDPEMRLTIDQVADHAWFKTQQK